MAGFWDNLGQGLQTAGGILSPQVSDQLAQERNLQTQQAQRLKELQATAIMNAVQAGSMDAQAGQQALGRLGLGNMAGLGPTPEAQNAGMLLKLNQQALGGGGMPTSGLGSPTMAAPPQPAPQAAPAAPGAPAPAPAAQPQPNSDGPAVTAYKQAIAQLQTPQGQAMMAAPATAPRMQAQVAQLRAAAELEMQQKTANKPEYKEIPNVGLVKIVPGQQPELIYKAETTPDAFQKEAAELWGKDTPAYKKAIEKHLARQDAPTSVMINAGRQALDPETRKYMAQQYLAGDKSVLTGLARNPIEMGMMRQAIVQEAKAAGMAPADVAAKIAEYQGFVSGERALGTRQANVDMAVTEAQKMVPLALKASADLKRTGIKSVNDLLQYGQSKTSSPELRRLAGATNSLINIYGRAINPNGVSTDSDKAHAREVLDKGFADGDYQAAVDQLMLEMGAAKASPGQVKEDMHKAFTGGGAGKTVDFGSLK